MSIQERNNYCLCSVLSDIFLDYNLKISQDEIAKNLTPAPRGFMVDDNKIKNFLERKGFNYNFYWWHQTPFNEPECLLTEIDIHAGFVGINDHTFRVLDFHFPRLILQDPANETAKETKYYSVIKRLREVNGGFGLIKHL